MSYVWALITLFVACSLGWNLHGAWTDWRRRRNAKWVTVTMANGVRLTARVEDIDWDRFFEVESRAA